MSDLASVTWWLPGLGLLALAVLLYLLVRFARGSQPSSPEALVEIPKKRHAQRYALGELDKTLPTFDRKHPKFDHQSQGWRRVAKKVGRQLAKGGVHTVFYSHGTFVGNDPIGVTKVIQDLHPEIGRQLASLASRLIKRGNDWLAKDLGNFPSDYIQLCRESFGAGVHFETYRWSSANNHLARLEGAIELSTTLAAAVTQDFDRQRHRLLLIGHSHAGQVFALFTQLMGDSGLRAQLHELILKEGLMPRQRLADTRGALHQVKIDFVTLGTPPVYPWSLGSNHRLLHIINHRGEAPVGGSLSGLLVTKTGDYIQQYGASGSDILALTKRERQLNVILDDILGRGISMTGWINNLVNQRRLPTQGFTYLVDFKDNSRLRPNFLSTFMGHGVYTRYDSMLYLHRLIAQFFYQRAAWRGSKTFTSSTG